MSSVTVWFLGIVALGFGGIFYVGAYLGVRPILAEYGLLQYIPALGGVSAVIGSMPILVITWLLVSRLFSLLDIDKM